MADADRHDAGRRPSQVGQPFQVAQHDKAARHDDEPQQHGEAARHDSGPRRDPARYDAVTIALHWITAVLVGGLWVLAHLIDDFPSGWERIAVRSVHISCGVLLALLLLARVAWRLGAGRRLPPADAGLAGLAARGVHLLLYLLVAAVLLAGMANLWVRGDSIFGVVQVPAFDPGNRALRHDVGSLHGLLANLVLIVAGAHAVAALGHHFILRDSVLRRMLPRLGTAAGD